MGESAPPSSPCCRCWVGLLYDAVAFVSQPALSVFSFSFIIFLPFNHRIVLLLLRRAILFLELGGCEYSALRRNGDRFGIAWDSGYAVPRVGNLWHFDRCRFFVITFEHDSEFSDSDDCGWSGYTFSFCRSCKETSSSILKV
jgi:hypothetical protein